MVGGLEHEGVEVGFGELDDVIGLLALLLLLLRRLILFFIVYWGLDLTMPNTVSQVGAHSLTQTSSTSVGSCRLTDPCGLDDSASTRRVAV